MARKQRPANPKVRENLIRRMAARRGYLLQKSRRRDEKALDFGGYMLVDATSNAVVCGGDPYAFSADLEEIASYLD